MNFLQTTVAEEREREAITEWNSKYCKQLTPHSSLSAVIHLKNIFLQKFKDPQLVLKKSRNLWHRKVHYRDHRSPPFGPTLSQINPVCTLQFILSWVKRSQINGTTPATLWQCIHSVIQLTSSALLKCNMIPLM